MLATMRKLMAFEMTIAEWIGLGLMLAVPVVVAAGAVTWFLVTGPGVCAP